MSDRSFNEEGVIDNEEDSIRSGNKWTDYNDDEPPFKIAKKNFGSTPRSQHITPEREDVMIQSPIYQNNDSDIPEESERIDETSRDDAITYKHMGHHIKLPPEPKGNCDPVIQERIADMYDKMLRSGKSLLHSIQTTKKFRNPVIYEKLIEFLDIDERGTNYPPEFYNPKIWGPESYYDKLSEAQQRMGKTEREKDVKKETKASEPARKSKWN